MESACMQAIEIHSTQEYWHPEKFSWGMELKLLALVVNLHCSITESSPLLWKRSVRKVQGNP